jgi:hypothetical protein
MWKSGGVKPESVARQLPAPRSRWRGPLRLLVMMSVLFVTVVFIFPLVFRPGIEAVTPAQLGSPFSMEVKISNLNVTPLTDVEYNCSVSKLTLGNGTQITDAKMLIKGTVRSFTGRHSINAPCETAYVVNGPVKAAEYTLTLTYHAYPWPQLRSGVYHFAAQIDGTGHVTGWKLN